MQLNLWLSAARAGDRHATRMLVERLRPRISKMAVHYARRCGEDPEDLLQEAWLGLLEALPELDMAIGQPEQYLISRARWRVLDTIKHERVRRCQPLEDRLVDVCKNDERADLALACALLDEFTGGLRDLHRDLLACLMSGLTWRETGDRLGCSSANIAYHVRQIRKSYEKWSAGCGG